MSGGTVAVLDVGKSNVKLSACTADGHVLETLVLQNTVLAGPPWRHHDLATQNDFVLAGLAALAGRHPLQHFVASGHGSGGMLVAENPDQDGTGLALPMIDYEQPLPPGIDDAYQPQSGGFFDRGSAVMMAATHTARQLFWAESAEPAAFASARWSLGIPQYWAWRLTGHAVSEASILGAQSHLWNVRDRRWSPIVEARGWRRLMPPFARAGDDLGPLRYDLARRFGLPMLRVHAGAHDSSVGFYRYQRAGLKDFVLVSTGTWIVCFADRMDLSCLSEARGMTCNADIEGEPLGGALTMAGREYSAIAGEQSGHPRASEAALSRLIARGTFALPSFGTNDGQFRDSAGKGRIVGPAPEGQEERHALAVLYCALLAVACASTLDAGRPWVLDGSFLRDPAFSGLVATLRPGQRTMVAPESYGIASGAALLCCQPGVVPLDLTEARAMPLPGLTQYAARWRALAGEMP